jgi:hypothetical protein
MPHLKQLQKVSSFYFMCLYEVHQSYCLTFISSIYLPPPTNIPPHCTIFTNLFFIFNSKVSQCISAMNILNFGQFNAHCYSPLSLPSPHSHSTAFSIYTYILYLERCNTFWYCWFSMIFFSFPSSLNCHRIVPLLQACLAYKYVYDHVCFYIHVHLFRSIFHIREKTSSLFFSEPGLLYLGLCK